MVPRPLKMAPDLLVRLGRYVSSDPAAVANARRSTEADAKGRRQRTQLAPGAQPGDPGQVLEAIEPWQCWDLLTTQPFGRLSFTGHSGVPVIVLVNYVIDGETVVLRSGRGPKLNAASRGDLVAFEADEIDVATRTGWSVLGVGEAYEVTDPRRLTSLRARMPEPWAAPARDGHTIAVPLQRLTGRKLCP